MMDSTGEAAREAALRAYLHNALALNGIAADPEAIVRIEEQFLRIAQIAKLLEQVPLGADDEPAPQFHP